MAQLNDTTINGNEVVSGSLLIGSSKMNVEENINNINNNLINIKAAVYRNYDGYNIASNSSEYQGTDFGTKIFDEIGLVYNYDSTNYKHTFTVPKDGVYFIHAFMSFADGVPSQRVLYGRLEKNDIEQSHQSKIIGPYFGADYIFLNKGFAGDTFRFTALQNAGNTIKTSGDCRLNVIYIGK